MRWLRSPWPLGVTIVALSAIQYAVAPSYDEQLRPLQEMLDPETTGSIGTLITLSVVLVPLLTYLWLVFWKYPSSVALLAWCKERSGRSLLWTLMLGGSAIWNVWDAGTALASAKYASAFCDLGWAACMIALRGVVVSRLAEER